MLAGRLKLSPFYVPVLKKMGLYKHYCVFRQVVWAGRHVSTQQLAQIWPDLFKFVHKVAYDYTSDGIAFQPRMSNLSHAPFFYRSFGFSADMGMVYIDSVALVFWLEIHVYSFQTKFQYINHAVTISLEWCQHYILHCESNIECGTLFYYPPQWPSW